MSTSWRLMRRRFRARLERVALLAICAGTIWFCAELAGFRGPAMPLGEPRYLSDIWWHLPVKIAGLALAMLLWPWRVDRWDDI